MRDIYIYIYIFDISYDEQVVRCSERSPLFHGVACMI